MFQIFKEVLIVSACKIVCGFNELPNFSEGNSMCWVKKSLFYNDYFVSFNRINSVVISRENYFFSFYSHIWKFLKLWWQPSHVIIPNEIDDIHFCLITLLGNRVDELDPCPAIVTGMVHFICIFLVIPNFYIVLYSSLYLPLRMGILYQDIWWIYDSVKLYEQ